MRTRLIVFAAVTAAIGVIIGVSAAADDDDGGQRTPVEAACQMLAAGDSHDDVYRAMVDLLDEHEYSVGSAEAAARLAVDRAEEQGC